MLSLAAAPSTDDMLSQLDEVSAAIGVTDGSDEGGCHPQSRKPRLRMASGSLLQGSSVPIEPRSLEWATHEPHFAETNLVSEPRVAEVVIDVSVFDLGVEHNRVRHVDELTWRRIAGTQ
jgi:hypothetical protein